MKLGKGDSVIGMSILNHVEVDTEMRDAYLKTRRSVDDNGTVTEYAEGITPELYDELNKQEEVLLAITVNGYGKRTNAYEYRVTNRGGQGIINIETSSRNGEVIATFPITDDEQIMLVTNGGKLIRTPVTDIRIAGRNTQGVTLFKTSKGEQVVSVTALADDKSEGENGEVDDNADDAGPTDEDANG
jgi:DNA gyrase subunit A